MFLVAAVQALVLMGLEKRLRRRARPDRRPAVPPLLTLERFLFRLIAVGFVLLTLTLASGMLFTEQLFGKPLVFTHKSVFSVLGWLTFGALLSAAGATAGAAASRCAGSSPAPCSCSSPTSAASSCSRSCSGASGTGIAWTTSRSSTLGLALAVLLAIAGFFSIAETAMMAVNRYRLKHRAQRGERGAKLALALLGRTDALLGVILLGNTLVAAGAATLTAVITKRLFGEGELALALGTVAISFALLVFSEITPKVVGAMHADRIAPIVSYILAPMLKAATPDRVVRQPLRPGTAQAAAHQAHERIRVDADAGGAALAGARGPVFPRQAPRAARQSARPRGRHASTT